MKRNKFLCVIAAFLLLFGVLPSTVLAAARTYDYQAQAKLSTWLWDASEIVNRPDSVIQSLTDRGVKQLLLQIDPSIDMQSYRAFIGKATASGIQVSALDGAPEWAAEQGERLQTAFLDWLSNYQQAATETTKFTGIHIDAEPYELEGYESNTNLYLEGYQAMIVRFQEKADQLGLTFGIDIPFWFYGVNYANRYGTGTMAEWLCQRVKNMTIMAYRDKAAGKDGILAISAAEMKLFQTYQVNGTIAVETGRLSEQNDFVTFYEESEAYMNKQLQAVYESYKTHPEFAGIAVHYLDSWVQMK